MPQRFDDSFLVRLIREFFLLLIAVALLELLIRFGTELADFHVEQPKEVAETAEDLAGDVQTLMLNRGGPVAARTMYPILDNTHEQVGYEVAIVPSAVTVESIEKNFGFTPRGIPARWPEGIHHAERVELTAEEFCLGCHVDAGVGDVLGHVEVRKYLFEDIGRWWHEVQITTVASMGKIILHTILLYLLLRIRMEPLNSLRHLVGRLAQAGTRLDERAVVRSRDEFGQLANDMNAFLDRVSGITTDVESVLERIAALNVRLQEVRGRIEQQADTIRHRVDEARARPPLDPATTRALVATLEALARQLPADDPLTERLERSARALDALAEGEVGEQAAGATGTLNAEVGSLSRQVSEMAVLEERMQAIAQEGSHLLERLVGHESERGSAGTERPAGNGDSASRRG